MGDNQQIQAQIDDLASSRSTLQSEVSGLQSQVNDLNGQISAINAKLTTARTFLNDVDTSFTTKKTNLSTNLDTSANLFQTAVDDTTVGEALKKHNSDIDTKISAVKTAVQSLITRLQNQLTTATTNRS